MRITVLLSRSLALLVAAAAALALLASGSSRALAEPTIVLSSPAADEQLTASPTEIRLVFSEPVSAQTAVAVACNGVPAPVGPAVIDPDTVTVRVQVTGTISQQKCNVTWTVPLADGTKAVGTFSFDVLAATADTAAPASAPDATTAPDDTAAPTRTVEPTRVGGPLGLVRWIAYIALAALFGGLLVIALSWPEGVEYGVTLRYLRLVWLVGLVATVLQTALATAQLGEHSTMASLMPTAWGDLLDTTPGIAQLARVLLTAGAGWVALRPERLFDPAVRGAALGIPALMIATFGFTRGSGDLALVGIAVGVGHALATAAWFGGLMLMTRVVLLGPGEDDLVHAVDGYLRRSTVLLGAAVATGAVQTYRLDGGGLLSSGHGRLLLLKVAGVAAMAYIGMAARPVILNRLARTDHMDARTAAAARRALSTEWMIGVVVLALTAWMVSTTPSGLADDGRVSYAYDSGRTSGDLEVRVRLTTGEVGRNGTRVEVFAPTEGLSNLRITFTPPVDSGAASIRLDVPLEGVGAAVLAPADGIPLTVPGQWTIAIDADGPNGAFETITVQLPVGGDADELDSIDSVPADSVPADSVPATAGG